MKVDPDVGIPGVGDFANLLHGEFKSALPTAAALERAFADPRFASLLKRDELGRALAQTSVQAMRFVAARASVDIGVPTVVLDTFEQMLSIRSADQAVDFAVAATFEIADVLIDVAVEAMGAVPFVGWVGKLVKAVLDLIQSRIANKRPRPPLISWNETADNELANRMLASMRSQDWTQLFSPVYTPSNWGQWEAIKLDGGWLLRPEQDTVREGAFGGLPGGPLGSVGIQSRNCVDLNVQDLPTGGLNTGPGLPARLQASYNAKFARALECVTDIYETTPSLSRIALAAWQQMTNRSIPAMFQVDTRAIKESWRTYVETGIEASQVHRNETSDRTLWLAWRNLGASMSVRNWQIANEPARTLQLHELAGLYVNDLRTRQRAALGTTLAAYAQESQAAFRDRGLHDMLLETRRAILNSPLRLTINPLDVLDEDYRAVLVSRGARGEGQGSGRVTVTDIPGALPLPVPKPGADGGGGGGGAVIAIGLGLLALIL